MEQNVLICFSMEQTKKQFKKVIEDNKVDLSKGLVMKSRYPASQIELASYYFHFDIPIVEDITIPRGFILLKDGTGHILRQFAI